FFFLLLAQQHFSAPHQLIVQPHAVFVRSRLRSHHRRPAQQSHSNRRLKDIRSKRAAVHVEFHAQISRVGHPRHLIPFFQHHRFGNHSHQHRSLRHSPFSLQTSQESSKLSSILQSAVRTFGPRYKQKNSKLSQKCTAPLTKLLHA